MTTIIKTSPEIAPTAGELATLLRDGHPILRAGLSDVFVAPTGFDNRKSWDNWSKNGGGKRFDNRPTWDNKSWDNWSKNGGGKRFDNRPTWDNWKKR